MAEWRTNRSIQKFLQEQRAESDPIYNEKYLWDQASRREMKIALAWILAAAGAASLFIAIMYPIAQEQEKYREKYCPTHPTAIECEETPTVPTTTPIHIPDVPNAMPVVISRR